MPSNRLTKEKIDEVVDALVKVLEKEQPHLQPFIQMNPKAIKDAIREMLNDHEHDFGLKPSTFADPKFQNKLTETVASALGMNMKTKDANGNVVTLNEQVKKLFDKFGLGKEDGKQLNEAEKKQLKKELAAILKPFTDELVKKGVLRPEPGQKDPSEKLADEIVGKVAEKNMQKEPETNKYANLDSLISLIPGCLPVVVTQYNGDPNQFGDDSPYNGYAPREGLNNPNDSGRIGGDYLGLNADTMANFLQSVGGAVAGAFQKELHELGVSTAPRLEG